MSKCNSKSSSILIGPLSTDEGEAVGAVNRTLIEALGDKFTFTAHCATRTRGVTRQSSLNLINGYYFARHFASWLLTLLRLRPNVAHYAITSNWNMEKSLAFLTVARWLGAKTVGHLHGGAFMDFWSSLPKWRRRLAYRQLRGLGAFVVLSEGWKRAVQEQLRLDPQRLYVVNNPISSIFEEAAREMAIPRAGGIILCFGVMDKKKGVFDIIEAVSRLPKNLSFEVRLVGPEREPGIRQEVEDRISRQGLAEKVVIIGPAFGAEKIRLFKDAAIFLLPSYVENFPLVVLEAAAAGLPIITTPTGAVPEFFDHNDSAVLVRPGDTNNIAAALTRLLACSELREALGKRARAVFTARLARGEIGRSMERVYRDLLV